MTKRQLIDRITQLNPTAAPDFLAGFAAGDLAEYLEHLEWARPPTDPAGDAELRADDSAGSAGGRVRLAS